MSILAFYFWSLAIGTSASDGGVDLEELGSLIVPWADSAMVVSVGSEFVGLTPWANSTTSAKFTLSGCNSTQVHLRGGNLFASSLMRPISTISVAVRRASRFQMGTPESLHRCEIMQENG